MRHLLLILILLLPGIAASQSTPATQDSAPATTAAPTTAAPAESTPADKPAAAQDEPAPAVWPGKKESRTKVKPGQITPAVAPEKKEPRAKTAPTPPRKTSPARSGQAAAKPSPLPNATPEAGAASTAPAKSGNDTTGSAPTKWPDSIGKPKAAPAPKPAAAAIKPKPRRRGRVPIKRSAKPQPAPKPRIIPVNPATPAKYAGTYRIESWKSLQERGLYHFFYLQPGGAFLLGAEWPGRETSRAAGEWQASGNRLSLTGTVEVSTNKGRWRVPFRRSFHISLGKKGLRLEPLLEKNRFGLLGWPNAYFFFRTKISPNLPSRKIPVDDSKVDALIKRLRR